MGAAVGAGGVLSPRAVKQASPHSKECRHEGILHFNFSSIPPHFLSVTIRSVKPWVETRGYLRRVAPHSSIIAWVPADNHPEIVRLNDQCSIRVFNIPEIRDHVHNSSIFPEL